MNWQTSCPNWEEKLINHESIIPPPIFQDQADQALAIFKELRVPDLPGKPTFGECSDQFVFDFVAAIFGAYDSETGNQLIREFFLLIAKKNTKSTIAAGIMLTALILCWRSEEEHLILAPTKEVADNAFKPAAGMVRADEELLSLFHVQDHVRTITHRVNRSSLKVVAADTDTVSGKKSGRILVEEHWLFGKKHNAVAMFMEALGGQISRDEGWVIYLTTQSDDPPAGVFKEKLQYFRDVRDGVIEDKKSLGILYEFPQAMIDSKAYMLEENFYITNPNIGRSVSSEWLVDNLKKNQEKTDGSFQQFLAKHLNIEIGLSLRSDRWAGADFWESQSYGITLDYIIEHSEVIVVGIDGGGLDDLLGLAVIGREVTGDWLLWNKAWAHPIALERRKENVTRYKDFEQDGDLVIVKHVGQDIKQLVAIIKILEESGLLDRVGVDPAGIGDIIDAIETIESMQTPDGKDSNPRIVGIPQGWRMSGATKTTERRLAYTANGPEEGDEEEICGAMRHGGQPLMAWCVSNARVEQKGNAISITKQASGTGKIDPLVATLCAAALMAMNPEARGGISKYETEGLLIF